MKRALLAGPLATLGLLVASTVVAGPAAATVVRSADAACDAAAHDPRGVLVIGDSITMNSAQLLVDELSDAGWKVCLDAQSGRRTDEGIDVLRDFVRRGQLAPRVVLALGTNDVDTTDAAMRASVREAEFLTTGRRLIWVNGHRQNTPHDASEIQRVNAVLAAEDAEDRDLSLIDWHGYVIQHPGPVLIRPDGIHLTELGSAERTDLLLDRLDHPFERP